MSDVRPCDGCTACCSVFGVEEIGKAPWTGCEHLVDRSGCQVYETRPAMCREFYCLWQGGAGGPFDRPDRLGVIFAPTNGPTEFTGEEEYQAYELMPGMFATGRVVRLAKQIAGTDKLIIGHRHGGEVLTFIGPPEKIKAAQEWVKKNAGA